MATLLRTAANIVAPNVEQVQPPLEAINVLHSLQGLWAARVIGQDALFLGAQVCQQMVEGKLSELLYTGILASSRYTALGGTIYTGPISKSLRLYIAALQELHSYGGVHSYLKIPPNLVDENTPHFTVLQELTAGVDYTLSTPIYFKISGGTRANYFNNVNRLASMNLINCTSLQISE